MAFVLKVVGSNDKRLVQTVMNVDERRRGGEIQRNHNIVLNRLYPLFLSG